MKNLKPTIREAHKGKILYKTDPMPFLFKNNLAVQVGNGLFVLKGFLVEILDKIESSVCRIAKELGAEPVTVPCLLTWENAQKSHYLDSFANQAMMIKYFQKDKKLTRAFHGLISPTVCYHCFSSFKNGLIDHNQALTAIARCTRREVGNLNDLSRLVNFTMREVIFYGTKEYCADSLKKTLDRTVKMLNQEFDLTYKLVTANDPFFGKSATIKKQAQLILESKYELQTLLPFSNETISIGSFNNHGRVFYDRFNIKSKNPELGFSGCVGWGYERILYAILAQKGVNFSSAYYKKLMAGKK